MLVSRIQRPRLPYLTDRYSARQNAFGLIRVSLAVGVLVAHSWPLGFGRGAPGYALFSGQSDLGSLCLFGFFFVSGLSLIHI